MSGNLTSVNNISCSGSLTINNNIISTGNLQTSNISSQNINNSNSISTNSINATTGSLTNLSVSNILTLLSNTPIIFNYNSSNYNLSTLMLYTLQQVAGASIASQSYVNTQISNLVNSSPDLLNTLSELSAAINNDASFSTTITNLIATKVSLTSNNTISGSNTFNSSSGNIIDRLFSTIVSINNNNTRRNVSNYFECAMGQTSSYIYYDNTGKFGSINTIDSNLNWNIALNSVFTINTINSVNENISGNGIVNNLYSSILAINNNNSRRSTNDILEVATSSTGNYLYYNNSSTFGFINVLDSTKSWFINQNGNLNIPIITSPSATITSLNSTNGTINNLYSNILSINNSNALRSINDLFNVSISSTGNYLYYNNSSVFGHINTSNSNLNWTINNGSATIPIINSITENIGTLNVSTASTFQNLPNFVNTNDKLINKAYVDDRFTTANITTLNVSGVSSLSSLAINSSGVRGSGDLLTVSITPTGNYIYVNNGSALGGYNSTGNPSFFTWMIEMSGLATFRTVTALVANITTLNSTTGIITNLYSNILTINNNNTQRSSNDIFEAAISSTGNYIYYNNSSVFGHINVTNSNNSWYIDNNALAKVTKLSVNSALRSSNDLFNVSASSTSHYLYYNSDSIFGHINTNSLYNWYINSLGVCSLQNLCIGSANMRTGTDRLNVSLSNTGSYMFFNDGGTLGTYNTTNSSFPWFIELDGDSSFQSVNSPIISTPHLKATGKIRRDRVMDSAQTYNVTNSTTSLTYLTAGSSNTLVINLNALDESNNYNMYEFRCTSAGTIQFNASGVTLYDNLNASRLSISTNQQKYFKFHYIERNGIQYYYQFV